MKRKGTLVRAGASALALLCIGAATLGHVSGAFAQTSPVEAPGKSNTFIDRTPPTGQALAGARRMERAATTSEALAKIALDPQYAYTGSRLEADGTVTVWWKGDVPSGVQASLKALANASSTDVVFKRAQYSQQELPSGVRRLLPAIAKDGVARAQGITVTTTSIDADGSGLAVGVEDESINEKLLAAQLSKIVGVPVISVTASMRIYEGASRWADTPTPPGWFGAMDALFRVRATTHK